MSRIKIGQIGVSHEHASGKMAALRKLPDIFEIVGVVDDSHSPSAKFPSGDRRPYEGLTWMTEEQLLHHPGLQAVVVEVPNDDLVPVAARCAQHHLAIHMDKPAGTSLDAYQALLDACKQQSLPFQMGYVFRANPAFQLCARAVREQWLGGVFEIQANMSHNYGGEAYQKYLGEFPGGIMFNLGCHLIDFMVTVLGRPENVTPFLKSAPGHPDSIRNNCVAILEYPHATVTLRACSLEVNGLDRRQMKICGTNGTMEWSPLERFDGQPLEMRLTLLEGRGGFPAGTQIVDTGTRSDRYEDQLLELARIIRGELKNPYSYAHDALVHEVTLAAAGYLPWRR